MAKSTNSGRKSAVSRAHRVTDPLRRAASTATAIDASPKVDSATSQPFRELAPVGPHPTHAGRNANGTFAAGNDAHLETGAFSEKRWRAFQPELHADRVRILAAKGFTELDADPVMVRIIDGFIQADVMMHSFFNHLSQTGGPVSAKGRTRRAVEGWSRAADRMAKLGAMLGLERRARIVKQTPVEWLQSLDDREGGTNVEAPEDNRATRTDPHCDSTDGCGMPSESKAE